MWNSGDDHSLAFWRKITTRMDGDGDRVGNLCVDWVDLCKRSSHSHVVSSFLSTEETHTEAAIYLFLRENYCVVP